METHALPGFLVIQSPLPSLEGKPELQGRKKLISQADAIEDVSFYFGHFFKKIFSIKRSKMFLNLLSSEVEK